MSNFYRIVELCPLLDGLIVEMREDGTIVSLRDDIGGTQWAITDGAKLEIGKDQLTPFQGWDVVPENPFGKFIKIKEYEQDNIRVALTLCEKGATVTVSNFDGKRWQTKYSQNYFKDLDVIVMTVEDAVRRDIDDLIFRLKARKEVEQNG